MKLNFRSLKADEIDVRVQSVKENGAVLLLYKDARVDQNILDETVGAYDWQREHTRDNANCIVSIWDNEKKQWIKKEDTGVESNTEKEKGLASDSFKRACFNWGIGRELYTAPFIWINKDNININNGKTYDKFKVSKIEIENGKIIDLEIYNINLKKIVFKMNYATTTTTTTTEPTKKQEVEEVLEKNIEGIIERCEAKIASTGTPYFRVKVQGEIFSVYNQKDLKEGLKIKTKLVKNGKFWNCRDFEVIENFIKDTEDNLEEEIPF